MIDITQADFSKFKIGKSGRALKLLYDNESVSFCTSGLYTPFGVNQNVKDWSNFTEYSVECSLNQSTSEQATAFREFLERLDSTIENLLKDQIPDGFVYYNILKESSNYPKRMRLQLPRDKNGNFQSFIFDTDKTKIMLDDSSIESVISKGKVFKCIIECAKIWVYNGKAGSIWNINQLKFSEVSIPVVTDDTRAEDARVYSELMIA
jgi:hypothetical protein